MMTISPRRTVVRFALGGAVAGMLVAAAVMYIAWQHNPQGEYHEVGVAHWAWVELGLLSFGLCLALDVLLGAACSFGALKARA